MKSNRWQIFFLALAVLSASCSGKGKDDSKTQSGESDPKNSVELSAAGDPNVWSKEWRKEVFADKDPRKFWEQYSKAAQAQLDKPGADPSDITAKASALGRDPQAIFEFIRDQIVLEPYAGVLRGARGTLMVGAGNALDRTLLAQALLNADGIESRIIAGRLSDAQVDTLLERFLDGSPVPAALSDLVEVPSDDALKAEAKDISLKVGLPESNVDNLLQHARMQRQEFWRKTAVKSEAEFAFLRNELRSGDVKMATDGAALNSRLKQRLRQHYWLQVKSSDGSWSAFDPTFADAKPGVVYGTETARLSEIPANEYHRMEFHLEYHTITDGSPKSEELIAGTFASADSLFEPIEFRIQPAGAAVDVSSLASMQANQRIEMLRSIRQFQPVLRTGSQVGGGRLFDLDGNTYDGNSELLGKAGGSFFGDAFGGGDEKAPPQFVELRVVMRFTGPDRDAKTVTRALVRAEDLMVPTFAPPLVGWKILLQPQWLPTQFVGYHAIRQTVAMGNALMLSVGSDQAAAVSNDDSASIPMLLLELTLLRQSAVASILGKQNGVQAMVDEPMLTIFGTRLAGIFDKEGRIASERFVDIVENGVRYLVGRNGSQSSAFDAALHQGVADSAIEDGFMRDVFPNSEISSGMTSFVQSRAGQQPALLARAADVEKLRSVGVAESDIEWIRDNESPEAHLVVATTESGTDAWWSISPDGNAILRMHGGRGGTEEHSILHNIVLIVTPVVETASAMFCLYEISNFMFEGYVNDEVSVEEGVNAVVCIASQGLGLSFAHGGLSLFGLAGHGGSWAVLGGEVMWHFGIEPAIFHH